MWKSIFFMLVFVLFESNVLKAEEKQNLPTDLTTFVSKNKKCWVRNVIYEGTNLLLCSDGCHLFVQLQTIHPAIQMRLLMQGVTIYIDPTGKKKEKYAVIIPSANDVKDKMKPMQSSQVGGSVNGNKRPDIRPLVNCLSAYGAVFDVNGRSSLIPQNNFSIYIDEKNGNLIYSVLLPVEQLLKEKKLSEQWRLGIYTEGGRPDRGGPEFDREGGPHMREKGDRQPKSPRGQLKESDEDLRGLLKKDIEEWISFSFSTICSLNE